jgi:hypothetical protein
VSGRTHDLGEWAAFLSLGLGVWASWAALMWLLCDAHREDFDPRPWLARAIRSEAVYPLLREWDNARHYVGELADAVLLDARLTARETALTAAALLALLLPAPEGAAR